jgi:hypothetical protein
MRLSVLDPLEMAAHLDLHLQRYDDRATTGRRRLPLETLMTAIALRDRLRSAAALPGAGPITLDGADLDAVRALVDPPAPADVP